MSAYQGASGSLPVTLGVGAYVAIYPYEGGEHYIDGPSAGLVSVSTSKDITQPYGQFSLILSPGGPSGTSYPTWTQIITPNSFVLIGLRRGVYSQVVMMGIVTSCSENQTWNPGNVQRFTTVQGGDIALLFSNANYYNLLYTLQINALGNVGQIASLNDGLSGGTPAELGKAWYTVLMAGNNGIMSTVMFNKNGTKYSFSDVIQYWFQEYPYELAIPNGSNFLSSQGSWLSKFLSFFNYPWYEFFVITSPQGYYTQATGPKVSTLGALGNFIAAQTTIIARVNPFPYAKNTGSVDAPTWEVDVSLWKALPRNTNTNLGFISSNMSFASDEVRNFYLVNVVNLSTLYGGGNDDTNAFVANGHAWVDLDSTFRYGFLPEIAETSWFYDAQGTYAQTAAQASSTPDFSTLADDLTYRVISQYGPTPLMASGTAVFPMMPDMMPGTVFTYVPFKDGVTWDFYVQGVSHTFTFGGQNTTTLTLTRGLPSAVYADTSTNGLLVAILTAKAMKQEGQYQKNPKANGLKALSATGLNTYINAYGTLQGGVQPSAP
jgi:hypothetical protein